MALLPAMSIALTVMMVAAGVPLPAGSSPAGCEVWVGPNGRDDNSGRPEDPWASITHAVATVPDRGCVVWVAPGVYDESVDISRRFERGLTVRSRVPYRAVLQSSSTVVHVDGARNVSIEGFEVRHDGPGATGYVMIVDRRGEDIWSENIVIRNNVIHDSFDDDLLKVHSGSRRIRVERNMFYNQGPKEQHIDINSVRDVLVERNVFFNAFEASGRSNPGDTKHYIVVKDSNEDADGLLGSERVRIAGNVFFRWQGGVEAFVQIGNDGKPYHEARQVSVDRNLFLGDGTDKVGTAFGVAGARDIVFSGNVVSGDLPASSYAFRIVAKGRNPLNDTLVFRGNIWSDPTGTMGATSPSDGVGRFSAGAPDSVIGLVLNGNAYWNGGVELPIGDVASPADDVAGVVADPGLQQHPAGATPPVWTGSSFANGAATIEAAWSRFYLAFGTPSVPVTGAAAGIPLTVVGPTYAHCGNAILARAVAS